MTRNKNPLNEYSVIQTAVITADTSVTSAALSGTTSITGGTLSGSQLKVDATTIDGGNFTGVGTITGSATKVMGPSGSLAFADLYGTASGSLVASLTLKVNITGSTYYVQLWG